MLRIDMEACAKCVSCTSSIARQTEGMARVSRYCVEYNHGRYRWFVVLKCNGMYGIPITRNCTVTADDDEALYRELYGAVPDTSQSFIKEIESRLVKKMKKHCEMSKKCPYYELHLLK